MRNIRLSLANFRGGLLAAVLAATLAAPALHAQAPACDASSLKGAFGYRFSGFVYDNLGYMYILNAVGRMVSDGAGNLTGSDTYSFDGNVGKRQYTGTYTINEDCTGSLTLTPGSGSAFHADIVIVNNGNEVEVVQSDASYIVSGTMKMQNPATQTTTPPTTTPTPSAAVR